jgi:hypothetical protein
MSSMMIFLILTSLGSIARQPCLRPRCGLQVEQSAKLRKIIEARRVLAEEVSFALGNYLKATSLT